jgi:hypothetical protein
MSSRSSSATGSSAGSSPGSTAPQAGFDGRREEGFVDAMRDALHAYLRFAGATALEWPPHLRAEKRLYPVN